MPSYWEWLTTPKGDKIDTDYEYLDRLYNNVIRENFLTPIGALSLIPGVGAAKRFGKYAKRGLKAVPPTPTYNPIGWGSTTTIAPGRLLTGVVNNPKQAMINLASYPSSLWDEVKQISMTFGLPGTGLSSHGVSLGLANIKSAPWKKTGSEAVRTLRELWNPDRAVEANKFLTGGVSPAVKRAEIEKTLATIHPNINPQSFPFRLLVESELDTYARTVPNSRFKDILDLERRTDFDGGGLKTSDILAGTSKGSVATRQLLTRPVNVGKYNVNPFSGLQKEMFDTPLFGEEGMNTRWKRQVALDRLDELLARGMDRTQALQEASDYATHTLGGFGAAYRGQKSAFESPVAKFLLTAPDWTRRHLTLGGKKIQSITPAGISKGWGKLSDPNYDAYRKYLAKDAIGLGLTGAANYALNQEMPTRGTDFFNIELPKSSETSTRDVIAPFSTEMDFDKTIYDIAQTFIPGSKETKDYEAIFTPTRYRLHPMYQTFNNLVNNSDWMGNRLYNKERYTKPRKDILGNIWREQPDISTRDATWNILNEMYKNALPQSFETFGDLMAGNKSRSGKKKLSRKAAISQLFELPVRSYTPQYTKVETPLERRLKNRLRY